MEQVVSWFKFWNILNLKHCIIIDTSMYWAHKTFAGTGVEAVDGWCGNCGSVLTGRFMYMHVLEKW